MNAALSDALASVKDAGTLRTPPWMAVVSALACARPDGIGGVVEWLTAHQAELEAAYDTGATAKIALAVLPPELEYPVEIGGLDRPRNDHRLREKYLFADIVGRGTFFQAAIYAMTGIEISADDAAMLDEFGTLNLLIDRKVWPMAATRRAAARGGGYTAGVLAGWAMMGSTVLAGAAAAECARFLQAVVADGDTPVDEQVAHATRSSQDASAKFASRTIRDAVGTGAAPPALRAVGAPGPPGPRQAGVPARTRDGTRRSRRVRSASPARHAPPSGPGGAARSARQPGRTDTGHRLTREPPTIVTVAGRNRTKVTGSPCEPSTIVSLGASEGTKVAGSPSSPRQLSAQVPESRPKGASG